MVYKIASFKMGAMFRCRARSEGHFVPLGDFDQSVLEFHYEAEKIPYQHTARRVRNYFPDFVVHRITGETDIIEIKPEKEIDDDINLRKFAAAKRWCRKYGYSFHVITNEWIANSQVSRNIRFLRRYARKSPDEVFVANVLREMEHAERLRLDHLARLVQDTDRETVSGLYSLIYQGLLVTRIGEYPISPKTWVYLPEGLT